MMWRFSASSSEIRAAMLGGETRAGLIRRFHSERVDAIVGRTAIEARPIERTYSETSGITERMVETGSTPGSRTPTTVMAKTPTRQVLRNFAAVRMRSRTRASTNTGTSNASATPSRTKVTNR